MYKRIIVIVAGALFALLALLAVIITDLYDRDYPQAMGVESSLTLDFSEAGLSVTEAFAMLEELDARWSLGLVKVAPDLAGDGNEQIFAALNDGDLPAEFTLPYIPSYNNRMCATRRNRVMNRCFSCLNRRFLYIKEISPYKKEGWLYLLYLQIRINTSREYELQTPHLNILLALSTPAARHLALQSA